MRRRDRLWWWYTTITIIVTTITTTPILTSSPSRLLGKGAYSAPWQLAQAVGCICRLEQIDPSPGVANGRAEKTAARFKSGPARLNEPSKIRQITIKLKDQRG